jgi:predicted PurR-regulated permease PerM
MSTSIVPKGRRRTFLAISAAGVVAVMIAAREVMLPFILATVLAYVLAPLVLWTERRTRMTRGAAILLVYAVVFGGIGTAAHEISPRIAHEFRNLHAELPRLAQEANDHWVPAISEWMREAGIVPAEKPETEVPEPPPAPSSAFVMRPQHDGSYAIEVTGGVRVSETKNGWLVEPAKDEKARPFDAARILSDVIGRSFAYAQRNSLEVALAVRDLVARVSRTIFVFFITLMLGAYMILTRERILGFFRSLVSPPGRPSFDALLERMDQGLSGVVRGQLVICGINGVLSAIGFAIIGLKYWPVMALVAAVFSAIPIFGSIASAVPAVAVGLTQSLGTGVFALVWIVGIHQLEANVLNPKIMGDAAKIHPVLVIFALLTGEHLFHVVGALLAVPVMSIAQTLFLHVREVTDEPEKHFVE